LLRIEVADSGKQKFAPFMLGLASPSKQATTVFQED